MKQLSVLIPIDNNSLDITNTLYSLENQNFQDFNIFILSNSPEKICISKINPLIKILKYPTKYNIPQMLNDAVYKINTPLLTFLTTNELLLFYALKKRIECTFYNENVVASYGLGLQTDKDFNLETSDTLTYYLKNLKTKPLTIESIISNEILINLTALMIKTETVKEVGFNETLSFTYAHDFFIRLLKKYQNKVSFIDEPIYISNEKAYSNDIKPLNLLKSFKEYLSLYKSHYEKDMGLYKSLEKNIYMNFYFTAQNTNKKNKYLKLYILASYLKHCTLTQNPDFSLISIMLNGIFISLIKESV